MIISERIFQLLKEKHISQKTFSEKTGIAQSTISDWKSKKTNPASDKIMVICRVLDISPEELLDGCEGHSAGKSEYISIERDTPGYELMEFFRCLDSMDQGKAIGYVQALYEHSRRQ